MELVAFTDHQGSILKLIDLEGNVKFDASYDVWGRQTINLNLLRYYHGYTGHEMIPELALINMNGRFYDPLLARFLSPDDYVQEPDNSQNFNRFSYCLNNPLKYTDPSGEFWNLIIGAAIGGLFNWASNGFLFNAKGLGYFATGVLAGAVSAGLASGVDVTMIGGNFWTGAAGLANGMSSTGFLSGLASSASAGFAGGFITGAGNSWVNGSGFFSGLSAGFVDGCNAALYAGITGGIAGGFDALGKGTNFWTGKAKFNTIGAMACENCSMSDFKFGDRIVAKYKGRFEGQNVFESKQLGTYSESGGYSGFTLPDRGIFVGEGVFSQQAANGLAMMQHEFGHVLQYRMVGLGAYYKIIAAESISNCMFDSLFNVDTHSTFWTESWANYLSKNYFGKGWLGLETFSIKNRLRYYPSENISTLLKFIKFGPLGLYF